MIKTRVKYRHQADGSFATDGLTCANDILIASYKPESLEYSITSVASNSVVKSGKAVSNTMLKKTIKKVLRELGVQFRDEVRQAKVIA